MFKNKKYKLIKKAFSKDVMNLCENYILLKNKCYDTLSDKTYLSPYNADWGFYEKHSPRGQVPETYACYGDLLADSLLNIFKLKVEKISGYKLYNSYSYLRNYKKGDILPPHIDRPQCDISTTVFVGGSKWPFYLKDGNKKISFNFDIGDCLLYKGEQVEHWREPLRGENCVQVFLHYVRDKKQEYDRRINLGLPNYEFLTRKD